MPKPTLFIGCIQEEISLAEEFQSILNDVAEVKIWDHRMYFPGEYPIEALRREVLHSDFALLIISPDDFIKKRGAQGFTARDNILFELGLFMGVQGPRRALYVVVDRKNENENKTVIIPSDLTGLTRIQLILQEGKNNESAIRKASTEIKVAIERASKSITVNLLPSTALAIGYFNNFVLQVCEQLITLREFKIDNTTLDLSRDIFDFCIVIPENAAKGSHEGFANFIRRNRLSKVEVENRSKTRTFPFYVDSVLRDGRVLLFDYPTTIRSIRDVIRLAVPMTATDTEIENLETREIHNFKRTLDKLLEDPAAANFSDNIKVIYLNELSTVYNLKK